MLHFLLQGNCFWQNDMHPPILEYHLHSTRLCQIKEFIDFALTSVSTLKFCWSTCRRPNIRPVQIWFLIIKDCVGWKDLNLWNLKFIWLLEWISFSLIYVNVTMIMLDLKNSVISNPFIQIQLRGRRAHSETFNNLLSPKPVKLNPNQELRPFEGNLSWKFWAHSMKQSNVQLNELNAEILRNSSEKEEIYNTSVNRRQFLFVNLEGFPCLLQFSIHW